MIDSTKHQSKYKSNTHHHLHPMHGEHPHHRKHKKGKFSAYESNLCVHQKEPLCQAEIQEFLKMNYDLSPDEMQFILNYQSETISKITNNINKLES